MYLSFSVKDGIANNAVASLRIRETIQAYATFQPFGGFHNIFLVMLESFQGACGKLLINISKRRHEK
jgi:hypothetical protein